MVANLKDRIKNGELNLSSCGLKEIPLKEIVSGYVFYRLFRQILLFHLMEYFMYRVFTSIVMRKLHP